MTLIPANIAKKRTQEALEIITKQQLEVLTKKIDDAIKEGNSQIRVESLSISVRKVLEENGYKVLLNSQRGRDEYYSGYTISW